MISRTNIYEQEKNWKEPNKEQYEAVLAQADYEASLTHRPYESPLQFKQKNQFFIDKSDGLLLLYDPETNELTFEVAHGGRDEAVKKIRLAIDESSIAGTAAMTRAPVNVPDVRYDPRWNWIVAMVLSCHPFHDRTFGTGSFKG